jgi:hypothetical protein
MGWRKHNNKKERMRKGYRGNEREKSSQKNEELE